MRNACPHAPRYRSRLQGLHRAATALVLVLAAGLFGCSSTSNDYFPLESGLAWHYHIERTTMDGTSTLKHVIESLPPIEWRESEAFAKSTAGGDRYLYRQDDGGTHQIAYKRRDAAEFQAHSPPLKVIPSTFDTGTSWRQRSVTSVLENTGPPWETLFRILAPIDLDYRVDSTSESVVVPAGSFDNCLKLVASGEAHVEVGNYIGRTTINVEIEEWYAPGIGLVKTVRTERTTADAIDFGSLKVELERFIN